MPSELLSSTIPYLLVIALSVFGFTYAGYLSLSVWRGLSVPIYKSRALWTGILALLIGLAAPVSGNVTNLFSSGYYYIGAVLAYIILYPAIIIGLFVWIDRTVNTLIRLDYLRRDLALWNRLRLVYWTLVGAQFLLYFAYFFTSPSTSAPQSGVISEIYFVSLFVPLSYGSLVLALGSRRTYDLTFRLHARWLGLAIGAIGLIALADTFTTDIVIGSAPFLAISYCFYKLARHLVPVGKLQNDD